MTLNTDHFIKTAFSLAGMLLLFLVPTRAEAEWAITQFEVFAGAPYTRADGVIDTVGHDWAEVEDWFPNFNKAQVELALSRAARWYSENGFPEPRLEPVVQTANGPAYRVYVCTEAWWASLEIADILERIQNFGRNQPRARQNHWSACGIDLSGNSNWAAYGSRCSESMGGLPKIYINADGPAFRDGLLTVEGYQTIVHELFHAIQSNSVAGKSPNPCRHGKWFKEGMADAVGMHVLDVLWPTLRQPENDDWIRKRRGIRPYYNTVMNDPSGYPVSSLWKFLGELHGGYSYLVTGADGTPGVLDFEIHNAGNWKSEASWLDSGLLSKFEMRFNELFSLFLNDYSMHVAPLSWTSGDAEQDLPRWVNGVLGQCEEIFLSGRKTSHEFNLTIAPVAGGCAWLTVNLPQATSQVTLQTKSEDLTVFKDIWVGLAEGNAVTSDAVSAGKPSSADGPAYGIWSHLTVRSGFPTLLTFANIADDPQKTTRRNITFDISLGGSRNNLRSDMPAGPGEAAQPAAKPSYNRRAQTLNKKRAATTKMVTQQKNLDKDLLSPYAATSTSVASRPRERACQDPFKYNVCGPRTSINATLMPGTWGNFMHASGSGGGAGQVFSSLMSQALANPFDSMNVMQELSDRIKTIDAADVSIVLPFIDYGQTGTIDNAMISTKVGGQTMRSIGPPEENQRTPLIGSVTIEEYTPMRLRGSYSAPLAYFEPSPGPDLPPVFKNGPTLTGSFNVAAPWLSDERVALVELQSIDEIANDVAKSLGVTPQHMQQLRDQGILPGGSQESEGARGGNSGGSVSTECNCDCAYKGLVDDLCDFFCEEQFAACPE